MENFEENDDRRPPHPRFLNCIQEYLRNGLSHHNFFIVLEGDKLMIFQGII